MSFPPAASLNCLYCLQPAERPIGPEPDKNKAGKCPECGGPHHVWCWHLNGGCARPGCLCNPKTPRHSPIPFVPAQVHDLFLPDQGPEKANAFPDRWAAFETFETEYATLSHRLIASAWNDELFNHFQPAEKYRAEVDLSRRCVQTQDRLVAEYRRKRW